MYTRKRGIPKGGGKRLSLGYPQSTNLYVLAAKLVLPQEVWTKKPTQTVAIHRVMGSRQSVPPLRVASIGPLCCFPPVSAKQRTLPPPLSARSCCCGCAIRKRTFQCGTLCVCVCACSLAWNIIFLGTSLRTHARLRFLLTNIAVVRHWELARGKIQRRLDKENM